MNCIIIISSNATYQSHKFHSDYLYFFPFGEILLYAPSNIYNIPRMMWEVYRSIYVILSYVEVRMVRFKNKADSVSESWLVTSARCEH